METILKKIIEQYDLQYNGTREWKRTSQKKVVGCLPMYFPEELIHAAGMLPVTLFGGDEPITLADKHLMTNSCELVRGTFDSLLKDKYDFLDGIAALLVCDQIRFFFEVWSLDYKVPFFHQMWRPYNMDDTSRPFLISELKRLKSALEDFSGSEISSEALWKSMRLYNETRSLMRKLYDLRRAQPTLISAPDMIKIITASMFIPKEDYNASLRELVSKAEGKEATSGNKLRLIVSGHPCAIPDGRLLGVIEELGSVIVDDDFFSGTRYFATDVTPDSDPIEAFADYYMKAVPCTTYHYPENWLGEMKTYSTYGDYIIEMAKKEQAKGVILLKVMYCDPYDLEFVVLKEKLEQEKIPYLSLITEHGLGPLEPIKTRVQAFFEMLRQ